MDLVRDIQNQINWSTCDLQDIFELEDIIQNVDSVIHSAAVVSFQPKDAELMHQVNVVGTRDIINLSLEHKISRFVHISSIAALGRHKNDKAIDEEVEWQDSPYNTLYGISKQMAEREVWRGQAEGLEVCILNPSLILGAGYWDTGSPALFEQMHKGNPFYPTGSTGIVDVRDVAHLAILAMASDISGQRYIISSENISYRSILDNIATALHQKKPKIKLTKALIALLWRADAFLSLLSNRKRLATKETLASSSRNAQYIADKSIKTFNYSYITSNQTISQSCASYLESAENKLNHNVLKFPPAFLGH